MTSIRASSEATEATPPASPLEAMASRLMDLVTATLVNGIPVLVCDRAGRIVLANDALHTVLNYSKNELLNQSYSDVCIDLALDELFEDMEKTPAVTSRWSGDITLKTGERETQMMSATISALRDATGSPSHCLVVISDASGGGARQIPTKGTALQRPGNYDGDYAEAILNSLPGVFYHFDDNFKLVRWNQNFEKISGYTANELLGAEPKMFCVEEQRELVYSRIREVMETGESTVESDFLRKDGKRIPYLFTGTRFERHGRVGFVGVGNDLSTRKRIEEALRVETARFEAQVESSVDGILVVDENFVKVIQNQRLTEQWKIPHHIASNPDNAVQLEYAASNTTHPDEFIAKVHWLMAHPNEVSSDEIELRDGTVLDRYSAPVLDREGNYYGRTWIHRDITARKQSEQRIRHLASHDDLTGLCNRNVVQERIANAIDAARPGRRIALLYLDLDRFKIINDGYGHPFGDEVLKATAKRLQSLVLPQDTVARYGGDEFLILLTDLDSAANAHGIAKRIVAGLDGPLIVNQRSVHLSGTVGASIFPDDAETADELIGNADAAMYWAKELGRNTFQFYSRELGEEAMRRVDLETRLRAAIQNGRLSLAYQPKVSLKSGAIVGCEALARWHDPELGHIAPGRFIPVAEESGLIISIGDWVLRAACAQARSWLDKGLRPICVAVNVSARQLLQQDFAAVVLRCLAETGLPPELLEIELTETLIASDTERAAETFGCLSASGVKLSIDDFGTGYSSLSYLQNFRVDTLKIDKSFIAKMLSDSGNAAIVRAAISLGHNLQFKVLAEGVETLEQCRFLAEIGCDEVQGYFFSKPVPSTEFEALLSIRDAQAQQLA
ncbi:EAL domain-containing protein [Hyphomicrobium sp. D-2]|uniref:sensor domain-containing protein n=1 Tax=Hyphomicrobium sp. D-2 TaxID=3041621 RepID=UPI002454D246|nr:EAL domain-containing protein [Hyphomicrobium sp. D-2]MDH4982159.1 EAL domain-containing protein [Hyphomicrobium sp. D-2]